MLKLQPRVFSMRFLACRMQGFLSKKTVHSKNTFLHLFDPKVVVSNAMQLGL